MSAPIWARNGIRHGPEWPSVQVVSLQIRAQVMGFERSRAQFIHRSERARAYGLKRPKAQTRSGHKPELGQGRAGLVHLIEAKENDARLIVAPHGGTWLQFKFWFPGRRALEILPNWLPEKCGSA